MVNLLLQGRCSLSRRQQVESVATPRFHRRDGRFELYRSVNRADAQAHALRDRKRRRFDIAGTQRGLDIEGGNGKSRVRLTHHASMHVGAAPPH
jgi:hypothetical protein